MRQTGHNILAIESAIGGGSISLFSAGVRIDGAVGATAQSRAEDLLPTLDEILGRNDLSIADIDEIVVSSGPGSFTGIRIGLSTAVGLAAATRKCLRRVSALEAIALTHGSGREFAVVLPVGRDTVCAQRFGMSGARIITLSEPEPVELSGLSEFGGGELPLLLYPSISEALSEGRNDRVKTVDIDISNYLGQAAITHNIGETPEPLFVGKRK